MEALGHDCWEVTLNFGFKNEPDVPKALQLRAARLQVEDMETWYFLSRDIVIRRSAAACRMAREDLRQHAPQRAAAADFLRLPTTRRRAGSKVEI